MPYVEVWVDEEDVIDNASDDELIDELESRGFTILERSQNSPIFKIRQAYILESPENFRKFIENFLKIQGMPV
jgi:hypothetical protein